jgi:hypothetical protein
MPRAQNLRLPLFSVRNLAQNPWSAEKSGGRSSNYVAVALHLPERSSLGDGFWVGRHFGAGER